MHILMLSKRNADAQTRLLRSAETIARLAHLDPALVEALKKTDKDPAINELIQREAVADLLEALLASTGATDEPEQEPHPIDEQVTVVTDESESKPDSDSLPGPVAIGDELPPPVIEGALPPLTEPVTEEAPAVETKPGARKPRAQANAKKSKKK